MKIMIEELLTIGPNYGITIGTELAIDTLATDGSEHSLPEPISNYTALHINVYTLVRNVMSQFTVKTLELIKHKDVVRVVLNDIALIKRVLNNIPLVFYASTLMSLASHKYAPYLRAPRTAKQRRVAQTIGASVLAIVKNQHGSIALVNGPYTAHRDRQLLLTNLMMDLLSNGSAHLLESHTGKVRNKLMWYTKLHPMPLVDMKIFPPLHKMMLFIGTKDIFSPKPLSHLREQMITIANQYKWSAITTEQQVKSNIHKDQILYNNWNQLPSLTTI